MTSVAIAVLAVYFGYVLLHKSPAHQPQFEELRKLVRLLEQHHDAKGSYPVLSPRDVPIDDLEKALADSGVAPRPHMTFSDADPNARYISTDGRSYGILFHFRRDTSPDICIVEMRTTPLGWWGQPPPCPL